MTEKTARPSRFPGNGTEREAGQNAGGLARAPSRLALMPRGWLIYCGIGLGALVIRLIYLLDIYAADVSTVLLGDARSYHMWAQGIVAGEWIGDTVFFQAPFYPYFLAIVYSLFGESNLAVRVIQMILGSGACVLLARAGHYYFGRNAGILAGLILAVYPPAIFFDGIIQKASLTAFLLVMLIFLLGRFMRQPRTWLAFLSGCILGCLALTRENALILVPVVFAWIIWRVIVKSCV